MSAIRYYYATSQEIIVPKISDTRQVKLFTIFHELNNYVTHLPLPKTITFIKFDIFYVTGLHIAFEMIRFCANKFYYVMIINLVVW